MIRSCASSTVNRSNTARPARAPGPVPHAGGPGHRPLRRPGRYGDQRWAAPRRRRITRRAPGSACAPRLPIRSGNALIPSSKRPSRRRTSSVSLRSGPAIRGSLLLTPCCAALKATERSKPPPDDRELAGIGRLRTPDRRAGRPVLLERHIPYEPRDLMTDASPSCGHPCRLVDAQLGPAVTNAGGGVTAAGWQSPPRSRRRRRSGAASPLLTRNALPDEYPFRRC